MDKSRTSFTKNSSKRFPKIDLFSITLSTNSMNYVKSSFVDLKNVAVLFWSCAYWSPCILLLLWIPLTIQVCFTYHNLYLFIQLCLVKIAALQSRFKFCSKGHHDQTLGHVAVFNVKIASLMPRYHFYD